MSYRLIDANALTGVISNDDYEKVLNAPCIFADLSNGLDGEHYNLQESKTGHWVEENINEWSRKVFCSECGCTPPFEHVSNGDVYSASGYGVTNKTKFCPNCGARMRTAGK